MHQEKPAGNEAYQFSLGKLLFAVTLAALMMAEVTLLSARLVFLWVFVALAFGVLVVIELWRRRRTS